jgi:hypothetical protein
MNYVNPKLVTIEWTEIEDETLLQAFTEFGPNWFAIAALLPGRARNSVKNRYTTLQHQMVVNRGLGSTNPPKQVGQYLCVEDPPKTADPFSFLESLDDSLIDWEGFEEFGGSEVQSLGQKFDF